MLLRKSKENRQQRVIAAVAFVVMVSVNALANILPFNGQTSGAVSDKYANLFAPAGFTFAIWSVIYLLLGAYTLYQLGYWREKKSKLKSELMNQVREELLHFFNRNKDIAEKIIAKAQDTQQLRKELQEVKKLARERAKAITLHIPQLKDCKQHFDKEILS